MIKIHLFFGLIILLGVSSQKEGDEGRPYEFSFTIDGEQHRYEKKDVNGIIQGEFGFITGDGVYHVTVYATDENGSFKILSMKNTKISEPLDRGGKPSTAGLVREPTSINQPAGEVPVKSVLPTVQPSLSTSLLVATATTVGPVQPTITASRTPYDFTTASTIRNGCSSCGIVTKSPPGPLNFQNPAFKKPIEKESSKLPAQSLSSPNQPPPKVSDKGVPITSSASSVNLPNNTINSVQPPSYSNQLVLPPATSGNEIPSGLISKPISPTGEPSTYPNTPSGPTAGSSNVPINNQPGYVQSSAPETLALAPGTKPIPKDSNNPTDQNRPLDPYTVNQPKSINNLSKPKPVGLRPLTKQPPAGQTQNQIGQTPVSALSQVAVSDGVIRVPGNEPIQIKDKYPNMVNGLPEGITERDISDLLYKFNYTVGFHGHYEKGLKNGAKIGGYFVNGRDGISRVVTYVADENGYRPKFKLINLGIDSEDTPKPDSEKKFGLKNFEFIWYPIK